MTTVFWPYFCGQTMADPTGVAMTPVELNSSTWNTIGWPLRPIRSSFYAPEKHQEENWEHRVYSIWRDINLIFFHGQRSQSLQSLTGAKRREWIQWMAMGVAGMITLIVSQWIIPLKIPYLLSTSKKIGSTINNPW